MKRMIIAAALLIVAAGCSKLNDTDTVENTDVKIEFTIAEKPGFGAQTKALKTSWAVGDKIAIALKPSSAENILSEKISKSEYSGIAFILEYTESGWTASEEIVPAPGTNGTFYAVHHRGEMKVNFSVIGAVTPANSYKLSGYQGGELMSFTGSYSVADNGNITLGAITMALDSRLMQISTAEILEGNENTDNDEFAANLWTADEGETIEQPEKTVKMSIYKNWTSGNTPATMSNWVALSNGSVSVDFSTSSIFVYSTADQHKTGATPVLNYYNDEIDSDFAFCFAYTGKAAIDISTTSYTFYIERTPEEGAEYTISYDELYQTVEKSSTRTLEMGKAVKLSDQGWTAVVN